MLAGGGSRGFWGNKKDWTPNNNRLSVTPIESVYIGTRVNGITFNLESLDNDFSGDHKH